MWRGLFFASMVYAAGHPRFDGYRPAVADRALQNVYRQVNRATGSNGPVALLDYTRPLRRVSAALDRFNRSL
jgi:hypothetical protein